MTAAARPGLEATAAPALRRLLALADRGELPIGGTHRTVFHLFGHHGGCPSAEVAWVGEGGDPAAGPWLRADPVHLRADFTQVVLADPRELALDAGEAEALAADLGPILASRGMGLEVAHPARWYLRLERPLAVHTTPIDEVVGRDVAGALPVGPDRRRSDALLAELQMQLHQAPANLARARRGRAVVNSLWLWGEGSLAGGVTVPPAAIVAGDEVAAGLAAITGIRHVPVPDSLQAWRASPVGERPGLVLLEATRYDRLGSDPRAWSEAISSLEADWFAPALEALRSGAIEGIELYPCDGRVFRLRRRHRLRLWRRTPPLADWIETR